MTVAMTQALTPFPVTDVAISSRFEGHVAVEFIVGAVGREATHYQVTAYDTLDGVSPCGDAFRTIVQEETGCCGFEWIDMRAFSAGRLVIMVVHAVFSPNGTSLAFTSSCSLPSNALLMPALEFSESPMNKMPMRLQDCAALSALAAARWPSGMHSAIKRATIMGSFALVSIPRLVKELPRSLRESMRGVMRSHSTMRYIMAYATPYCTPSDLEESKIIEEVMGRGTFIQNALMFGGLNPNAHLVHVDRSLIGLAAQAGRIDIIELLVSHGAHFADTMDSVITSTIITIQRQVSTIECLLRLGADITRSKPLDVAINVDPPSVRIVALLLRSGADIDAPGPSVSMRRTPLCQAIHVGADAVSHLLIESGADVNKRSFGSFGFFGCFNNDDAPLHVAARLGNNAIVKHLLRKGADVRTVNAKGYTPLTIAMQWNITGVIDTIIKAEQAKQAKQAEHVEHVERACKRARYDSCTV